MLFNIMFVIVLIFERVNMYYDDEIVYIIEIEIYENVFFDSYIL